jgi:hypothetical protein
MKFVVGTFAASEARNDGECFSPQRYPHRPAWQAAQSVRSSRPASTGSPASFLDQAIILSRPVPNYKS